MAMIKCPECNADISDAASQCPKCGKPISAAESLGGIKKGNTGKIIFVAIVIFAIIGAVSGGSGSKKNPVVKSSSVASASSDTPKPSAAQSAPAEPVTIEVINARTIWSAFDANEVAAEKKYKGKLVAIPVVITKISTSIFGYPTISCNLDEFGLKSILFTFPEKYSDQIATLKRGQQVVIAGKVSVFTLGMMLSFDDCFFPEVKQQ